MSEELETVARRMQHWAEYETAHLSDHVPKDWDEDDPEWWSALAEVALAHAAQSVVEDLEGALRTVLANFNVAKKRAAERNDAVGTQWMNVEHIVTAALASLPSPEPTQLDAVSFVGEGDPDRPFPPPLVARWLLHRSVPANDLVDELDYWAHRMARQPVETFPRRARTIDEAMPWNAGSDDAPEPTQGEQ